MIIIGGHFQLERSRSRTFCYINDVNYDSASYITRIRCNIAKKQLIKVITTDVLVRHHGTNGAIAKSNMASVGHIEKFIFLVSYTTCTCNTPNVTNSGMQNSVLILFSSLGVIFSLKGHGQGHLVTSTPTIIRLTV